MGGGGARPPPPAGPNLPPPILPNLRPDSTPNHGREAGRDSHVSLFVFVCHAWGSRARPPSEASAARRVLGPDQKGPGARPKRTRDLTRGASPSSPARPAEPGEARRRELNGLLPIFLLVSLPFPPPYPPPPDHPPRPPSPRFPTILQDHWQCVPRLLHIPNPFCITSRRGRGEGGSARRGPAGPVEWADRMNIHTFSMANQPR